MKKNKIIFEWDGKTISSSTAEEQKAFDEYDKHHTDHPEFYPDYEEIESQGEKD